MDLSKLKVPPGSVRLQRRRPDFSALGMPVQLCFQDINGCWFPLEDAKPFERDIWIMACGYAALFWRQAVEDEIAKCSDDPFGECCTEEYSEAQEQSDLWQSAAFERGE